MEEGFAGFDWDIGNRAKCQKHGVSVAEVEGLFSGKRFVRPVSARYMHREEVRNYEEENSDF